MKIIHISEIFGPYMSNVASFSWIADSVDSRAHWQHISTTDTPRLNQIQKVRPARYLACWRGAWAARKADVVVTHGELLALWTGLFMRMTGAKAKHIAWAYTMPEFNSYNWFHKRLLTLGLKQVDRFTMFSTIEAKTYPALLNLDPERFRMVPWGVGGAPQADPNAAPLIEGEYLAAIGGEGRDYKTLFEAMKRLPQFRLVVVASPKAVAGLDVPENVTVKSNIPLSDAMNIAGFSSFLVLPLISDTIPCGHGSLVSQFYLNRASIVTASAAMEGYVFAEENALTYPVQDIDALARQIERLASDPELRERIANAGLEFAHAKCSESYTVDYFNEYLYELGLLGRPDTDLKNEALPA